MFHSDTDDEPTLHEFAILGSVSLLKCYPAANDTDGHDVHHEHDIHRWRFWNLFIGPLLAIDDM